MLGRWQPCTRIGWGSAYISPETVGPIAGGEEGGLAESVDMPASWLDPGWGEVVLHEVGGLCTKLAAREVGLQAVGLHLL